MLEFIKSATLLLVLLNPFLVIIYLIDVVQKLDSARFAKVLFRAGLISIIVFWVFAILGDRIFSEFVQVEFASFQIFGGIIFLLIGIEFVFKGPSAIQFLRGEAKNLAAAIAMPILIGPGTISASMVIGKHHTIFNSLLIITFVVLVSLLIMFILKRIHDYVRPRNEFLVERYIEVAGRITSLFIGTISIEMIMKGVGTWIDKY